MRIEVNLVAPVTAEIKHSATGSYLYAKAKVAHNDRLTGKTTFMNCYFSGDDAAMVSSFTTKHFFSMYVPNERLGAVIDPVTGQKRSAMEKEFTVQQTGEIKKYNDVGRASHVELISYPKNRTAETAQNIVTAQSNPGVQAVSSGNVIEMSTARTKKARSSKK